LSRLKTFKAERSNEAVDKALAALARATEDESDNIFARILEAVEAGATNGEICAKLRDELGYGHPLVAA
jgi:methylmalonyl-CoA mutase N-terminal domain/subunit